MKKYCLDGIGKLGFVLGNGVLKLLALGHQCGKISRGSCEAENLAVQVEDAIPPGGGVGSLFGQDKVGCRIGEGSVAELFAEDGSLGGRTSCALEEIGIGAAHC